MASFHRRSTKKGAPWQVRWRDLSGRNRARGAPDRETAKELCRLIEREHALGRDWRPQEPDRLDLREAFGEYLIDRSRSVSEGRMKLLNFGCVHFLDCLQAAHPRTALTPGLLSSAALARYHAWLQEERGQSSAVAYERLRMVEKAWRWLAASEKWRHVIPPAPPPLELPEVIRASRTSPSWAEMDAGIESAGGTWYWHFWVVARFTGLRSTQLLELLWTDVDLQRGTLQVRGELGKTKQEKQGRLIPLSPYFLDLLRVWVKTATSPYVIPAPEERKPQHRDMHTIWGISKVRQAVYQGSPIHCFRHGFITELLAAGQPEHLVNRLVGHEQASMSTQTYADYDRLMLPELRKVVKVIPPLSPGAANPAPRPKFTRRKRSKREG